MSRLKLSIIVFFFAILGPLAFVIFQTYGVLEREERSQLAFFAQTLIDRMEQELAALIQDEENRAVDEYHHFLAQTSTGTAPSRSLSPLAELPYPAYILGYFQNNPDGSFQTPLAHKGAEVPANKQQIITQLETINSLFNSRKYRLSARQQDDAEGELPATIEAVEEDKVASRFAERYLARSKSESPKEYLGKKQQRVEKISPEQAFNVAREEELFLDEVQQQEKSSQLPAAAEPAAGVVSQDAVQSEITSSASKDSAYSTRIDSPVSAAPAPAKQIHFQVEVAPFQSVSIDDDQLYIFRRIAINNQIYRQGFIVLVTPLMEHLISAHFANQPLAEYTTIQLQRRDRGPGVKSMQAGVAGSVTTPLVSRVFPSPFDFLSVSLQARTIPASPARGTLTIALAVLALFLCAGLIVIYKSATAIVELSERRSQFVSSVTHELKTPLTNIRMYVEMLEQGIAATPEREQEYLGILSSESTRLSSLINNVLELAKLEKQQRQFHMESGDIGEVLKEVQGIMGEKLLQEGFILTIDSPDIPSFVFDREVIIQIMVNLIENSIKFGRDATPKQITITTELFDKQVSISVSDTGAGIPPADVSKIFNDFYRADNELTRTTGGTGIGLALVKKFVTAMGGKVTAANNQGPGCTITIFLPRSADIM